MPTLLISRDEIGPRRSRGTLSYIENLMLYPGPEDQEKRERAAKAILARRISDAIPPAVDGTMTFRQVREIIEFVGEAPRLSDIRQDSRKAFVHGVAAGFVLSEVIRRRDVGHPRAQLGDVMNRVASGLAGADGIPLSRKTLDAAVWPRFKTVAHMWAAFLWTAATGGEAIFPCRLDRLSDFLSVSEWYRVEGEAWRPKQSDRTILPTGETWSLAQGVLVIPAKLF